jgi:hypothetical protein
VFDNDNRGFDHELLNTIIADDRRLRQKSSVNEHDTSTAQQRKTLYAAHYRVDSPLFLSVRATSKSVSCLLRRNVNTGAGIVERIQNKSPIDILHL